MIDLKRTSGLALKYNGAKKELFLSGKRLTPDIRKLSEMKDVLLDKNKIKSDGRSDKGLYYMYRDVAHTDEMKKDSLRYDVTVIFPQMLGREYNKTAGHYHPMEYSHVSYPELYEVLHGEAHIIIEKINANNEVIDCYLIIAEAGDKILVPPNYGHITINTTDSPLIMANLVEGNFKSNYTPIKKRHGAAFYIIDEDGPTIIKNGHYKDVPVLKEFAPKNFKKFGIEKDVPMFTEAKKKPEKFTYLVKPHKYLKLFRKYFR